MRMGWVAGGLFAALMAGTAGAQLPGFLNQGAKTQIRLLLDADEARPGDTVLTGIVFTIPDKFHLYRRSTGPIGLPPAIQWQLPAGITALATLWPVPEKIEAAGDFYWVYQNEVMLLVPLQLATDFKPGEVDLTAMVTWQECDDAVCLDGQGQVAAKLAIGPRRHQSPQFARFAQWQSKLPKTTGAPTVKATWAGPPIKDERSLRLHMAQAEAGTKYDFMSLADARFEVLGKIDTTWADGAANLTKPVKVTDNVWPKTIAGVLVAVASEGTHRGYEITLAVDEPGAGVGPAPTQPPTVADNAPALSWAERLERSLTNALDEGNWISFLLVFLGGVLSSLTPCVYPMIPITMSYIGGAAQGKPLKGFILSLWYVLGIAIIYSALGLLAAKTGGAFGQATQTPLFTSIVAGVIGLMGLSMAGLFDLRLPSFLADRAGGVKGGFFGPLLMGMAMGVMAAPCVGPVLVVILAWVAKSGSLIKGFSLLFTFALGLGVLFLALGTFSSLLTTLPGAGAWMETVKHVFAIVLFALALWFLRVYAPVWLLTMVFGCLMFLCLSAWGAHAALPDDADARAGLILGIKRFLFLLGVILAVVGGLRGFAPGLWPERAASGANPQQARAEPEWIWDEQKGFAKAAEENKPVMMDFWAEWCVACNELDAFTYNQSEILELAKGFISIKMDVTDRDAASPAQQARKKYNVLGMPTVIFFDAKGRERERFVGFKSARELAPILKRVQADTRRAVLGN